MAGLTSDRKALAAILFLEGVGQGYNVISATNSSPQTTEVYGNGPRLASLMKWNWIGYAQVIAFMTIASAIARSLWPLVGGGLVVGVMSWCYGYAKRCAQADGNAAPAAATGSTLDDASQGAGARFVRNQGGQTTGGNPESTANALRVR